MNFPILAVLTFIVAFFIEALGTYVSVIGLSTLFGANLVIISLAIALDAGKLVIVPLLYNYWDRLSKMMRAYALIAATITMVITSAGAGAYLSGAFQKAIMGTQEGALKVEVLKAQQAKYEERKKQIDLQIANLPEKTSVNQRIRLMNGFKAEQQDLQNKITVLDKQLPEIQTKQIDVEAKAGPILYIAKAFDIPVESAVKWVIAMIIPVFDPLAVFLIIAGNFLLVQFRLDRAKPKLASPTETVEAPIIVQSPIIEPAIEEVASVKLPDLPARVAPKVHEPELFEDDFEWQDEPLDVQVAARDTEELPVVKPTESSAETPPAPPADREIITLSSLGAIKPDPLTIVDAGTSHEVGYKTGVKLT